MSYIKTQWKARSVQFPRRYRYVQDSEHMYFTPDEGEIYEEGTQVSPNNMNKIEDKLEELDNSVTELEKWAFKTGMIVMWSGNASNIPTGWVLCNGANGTPDLRNRFVIGAGSSYSVNASGGSTTKNISHTHNYNGTTEDYGGRIESGRQGIITEVTGEHHHNYSGTTDSGGSTMLDIMPPYYALCFIMKL